MRTLYHEFESLEHLLATRLLPGGSVEPIRFVVFGGTGAVGGASVIELCRLILRSKSLRQRPLRGEIYATGMRDKEVVQFVGRLYLSLGEEHKIDKIEPRRHYRIDDRIDLRFSLLRLRIPADLEDHVRLARTESGTGYDLERVLGDYFATQPCPLQRFVEELNCDLLHAVLVAIPLPSVATYTLGAIERLATEHGADHAFEQRVKSSYLKTFTHGLAVVHQLHARRVLIAHTTAVGGMYRVDGGVAEIRLGFAHSASGKRLADKKFFADLLTRIYLDHGFDVLVASAAIGIDAVEPHCRLPSDRAVLKTLAERVATAQTPPVAIDDLVARHILLYPFANLRLSPPAPQGAMEPDPGTVAEAGETDGDGALDERSRDDRPLVFGAGKDLLVEVAIRSGENGLFSVANCVALYHVMKVAIPEELAMVLVRRAVFGPERRRDWFYDQICYYGETENSYFALRLLDNYPQLVRAHHGPFAVQAYQNLGSSTHQARLHELGLTMLALRLHELGERFEEIPEQELQAALAHDLDDYLWQKTRIPAFEDLLELGAGDLGELLGKLCEVDTMESAGLLLGYDPRLHGRRERGREKFLARLATRIGRYLQTITSLGIPIVYRRPGTAVGIAGDRALVGPYVAPLGTAVGAAVDLGRVWETLAGEHGVPVAAARDWTIANNGFVDLRPHALASAAREPGPALAERVRSFATAGELAAWLDTLEVGSYFTTCGLAALELRLGRLYERLRRRKIQLGTRETWKHLFRQDAEGRHLISPGLIETVRMYSEGLGKVTGTEALWPRWGY